MQMTLPGCRRQVAPVVPGLVNNSDHACRASQCISEEQRRFPGRTRTGVGNMRSLMSAPKGSSPGFGGCTHLLALFEAVSSLAQGSPSRDRGSIDRSTFDSAFQARCMLIEETHRQDSGETIRHRVRARMRAVPMRVVHQGSDGLCGHMLRAVIDRGPF